LSQNDFFFCVENQSILSNDSKIIRLHQYFQKLDIETSIGYFSKKKWEWTVEVRNE
jgi:hypothetical protein